MVYVLAAVCGYAAAITVLFTIMYACTDENDVLHNTEIERLTLKLHQTRAIMIDTQHVYDDLYDEHRALQESLTKGERKP